MHIKTCIKTLSAIINISKQSDVLSLLDVVVVVVVAVADVVVENVVVDVFQLWQF